MRNLDLIFLYGIPERIILSICFLDLCLQTMHVIMVAPATVQGDLTRYANVE